MRALHSFLPHAVNHTVVAANEAPTDEVPTDSGTVWDDLKDMAAWFRYILSLFHCCNYRSNLILSCALLKCTAAR